MPELPEVETIRRQLDAAIIGRTITSVEVRKAKMVRGDHMQLPGKQIKKVRRYSKLLVIDLSHDLSIGVHLKMTGKLVYLESRIKNLESREKNPESGKKKSESRIRNQESGIMDYGNDKHTHIVAEFDDGSRLFFNDQRTFGYWEIVPTGEIEELPYVESLGPEFFRNLTLEQFISLLAASKKPIKSLLLDQQKVAGVGNIYANEGLWMAKIHPGIEASRIGKNQAKALFQALEDVMQEGIKRGGASEDNYRDAYGNKGSMQNFMKVYSREGEPCSVCGSHIKKLMLAGRGTYFCPQCQVNRLDNQV